MPPRCGRPRTRFPKTREPIPPLPPSPPLPPPPSPPPPLVGRRNTEASDIKRVKELGAHEFFCSADPVEAKNWLTDIERVFEVL
ncbi:unnamed protein product [Prunus brigantina]